MKAIQIFAFSLITILLASCGSAVSVSSDYQEGVDFKQYTTYEIY